MVFRGDALWWCRPLAERPISNSAMVALAAASAGNHDMGPSQVDGTAGGQDGAQP